MDYFIVNERCATIRTLARDSLAGYWITGFLAMLIAHLFLISLSDVLSHMLRLVGELLGAAIMVVISGPISLGIAIFSLAVARGQEPHASQIFHGFERLGKAMGVFWLVALKVFLWSLFALPFFFVALHAIALGNYVRAGILGLLALAACFPAIIAMYRYIQVFYILADNPEIGVFECVERSKIIMNGNKLKHFILTLSFLGWAILAAIPIGIIVGMMATGGGQPTLISVVLISFVPWLAMFFVEAYVWTSLAVFYDMIIGNLRPGTVQTTAEVLIQSGQTHEQTNYQQQDAFGQQNHGRQQDAFGGQQTGYYQQQESTQMQGEAFKTEHERTDSYIQSDSTQMPQNTQQTAEFKEEQASKDAQFHGDNVRQKEQES